MLGGRGVGTTALLKGTKRCLRTLTFQWPRQGAEHPRLTLPLRGPGGSLLVHLVPDTTFPSAKENTKIAKRATGSNWETLGPPGQGPAAGSQGYRPVQISRTGTYGGGTDRGRTASPQVNTLPDRTPDAGRLGSPADTAACRTAASTVRGP